jgi:hypothetical protein
LHVRLSANGYHGEEGSHGPCTDEAGNRLWKGFEFDVSFDGNKMLLNIGKARSPIVCDELIPLTAKKFAYTFDSEVEKVQLEIKSNGRTDVHEISIQEAVIRVIPLSSSFTQFRNDTIERVPQNVVYASCVSKVYEWFYPEDERCTSFYKDIESIATPYTSVGDVVDDYYLYSGPDQNIRDIFHKYSKEWGLDMSVSTKDGTQLFRNDSHPDQYRDEPGRVGPVLDPKNPEFKPYTVDPKHTKASDCSDDGWCLMEVAYNTQDIEICKLLSGFSLENCYHMMAIITLDDAFCSQLSRFSVSDACRNNVVRLLKEND